MYIKVDKDNNIVRYPYFITDLILENPNTSWPSVLSDELLASLSLKRVIASNRPTGNIVEEIQPIFIDGLWLQQWSTRAPNEQETANEAESARLKRNYLLAQSDWTQVIDAKVNQIAWATYRQALRDITSQPGFPWEINWPEVPQ